MEYIKLFQNHSQYETFVESGTMMKPNMSHCVNENEVHYNQWIKPFFIKLTLEDNSKVEVEGSGEIRQWDAGVLLSTYGTIIGLEFGSLCTSIANSAFLVSVQNRFSAITFTDFSNFSGTIGDSAFGGCKNLTSVTFGEGAISVGTSAFNSGYGITELTIPSSTTLNQGAFGYCTGLTSVTFADGTTSVTGFRSCTSLTSVTIPDSVTTIGSSAFNYCSGLTNLTIGSGVTSIGSTAFRGNASLSVINSRTMVAPTIETNTFMEVKAGGTLNVPAGSTGYDVWMGTGNYYLGKYNWTKVEQ